MINWPSAYKKNRASQKAHLLGLGTGEPGFTLIEVIIVLVIIAGMALLVLPSLGSSFKITLNSSARQLAGRIKETYQATVVTGKMHRLVIDLNAQEFWVEVGPSSDQLETEASREKAARRKRMGSLFASPAPDSASPYKLETSITRKKLTLDRGIEFEDIFTEQDEEPIKKGLAKIHFFPHGITESALIHLKDLSEHESTIKLNSIGGNVDVYDRYVKAPEAFQGTP